MKKRHGVKNDATFQINENTLKKLDAESKKEGISRSVLINRILSEHVDWHYLSSKSDFISVRKPLVLKLMKKFSEREIISIAKYVARTTNRDTLLALRQHYDITAALDLIETWLRISGFSYQREISNSTYSYEIRHSMGKKWSLYLSEIFRNGFKEFGLKKIDFEITENTLSFRLDTNSES